MFGRCPQLGRVVMRRTCNSEAPTSGLALGPVVRTLGSVNQGLNFNPGFFFFLSKAPSRIVFSILLRVSNHSIADKEN